MARRNRDPEREAKREKMSSLLQELKVSSMEDIHDLFNVSCKLKIPRIAK